MMTIDDALHRYFHFDDFLDHQRQIIEKITAGEDICVVMPTGAGKSLCYQLPVLMRERYSLIVSPLIALMADQVAALRGKGIQSVNNPSRKGDLTFTVTVEVPRNLNAEQKDLLTRFAACCGDSNNTKKSGFFKKLFKDK